jgi:hypothetical protein
VPWLDACLERLPAQAGRNLLQMSHRLISTLMFLTALIPLVWLARLCTGHLDSLRPQDQAALANATSLSLRILEPPPPNSDLLYSVTAQMTLEGDSARDILGRLQAALKRGALCQEFGPWLQYIPLIPKPAVPWIPELRPGCGLIKEYQMSIPAARPRLLLSFETIHAHFVRITDSDNQADYEAPIKLDPLVERLDQLLQENRLCLPAWPRRPH